MGKKYGRRILLTKHLIRDRKVLLYAVNLRHGTDGFTPPPKEVLLRIFITLKNRSSSAGFKPANLLSSGKHATTRPDENNSNKIYPLSGTSVKLSFTKKQLRSRSERSVFASRVRDVTRDRVVYTLHTINQGCSGAPDKYMHILVVGIHRIIWFLQCVPFKTHPKLQKYL
jgi:hypothetical protein